MFQKHIQLCNYQIGMLILDIKKELTKSAEKKFVVKKGTESLKNLRIKLENMEN